MKLDKGTVSPEFVAAIVELVPYNSYELGSRSSKSLAVQSVMLSIADKPLLGVTIAPAGLISPAKFKYFDAVPSIKALGDSPEGHELLLLLKPDPPTIKFVPSLMPPKIGSPGDMTGAATVVTGHQSKAGISNIRKFSTDKNFNTTLLL